VPPLKQGLLEHSLMSAKKQKDLRGICTLFVIKTAVFLNALTEKSLGRRPTGARKTLS